MKYQIVVTKNAKKDIDKLDPQIRKRIKAKLIYFVSLPDPLANATALKESVTGQYRWRIGVYRVIFDVDKNNIVILKIRHRRVVYRK